MFRCVPIFEGEELPRLEPIYLQFSTDYGLRDGDWKLVSFKGQQWELYNLALDRAETKDLADAEPERVKSMVEKWRQISREVLHAEKIASAEMKGRKIQNRIGNGRCSADSAEPPKAGPAKKPGKGKGVAGLGIRARKNTQLTVKPGAWELTFSGEDPGVAIDLRTAKDLSGWALRAGIRSDHQLEGDG